MRWRSYLLRFAGLMIGGNAAILIVSAGVRRVRPNDALPTIRGVKHFHAVDRRVWRGSAPSRDGYAELAARDVRTVVDVRADHDVRDDKAFLAGLGVELVRIPIRDGQTPTADQVNQLKDAVRASADVVFLHCGAGVGRSGTMAAAYLVGSGQATPTEALLRNLAVGPPSLEQIVFVARLGHGITRPNVVVVVLSRTLDAPRRLWSRWRSARRVVPGRVKGR